MVGTKFEKPLSDYEGYKACADWANQNQCIMMDKGEYYECVKAPNFTKQEQIHAIKMEYAPRFQSLEEAQRRLLLLGKSTDALSKQYIKLNSEMTARIKEVK
ncbi:hypothetical protein [Veillonella caviae]|jgi:hypothetical protein|uniref:hypothetical protein n=1 Tax=Veillonella caviae TaxID=248316 RepID=UPI00206DB11A|nr:hypothetical protein [Veillonella caviae]MCI7693219.1 hypothetical protein [Veillonella caviae]MDY5254023.1 hypothetical protein [Veillonella caviae]DAN33125.1 MAG TPA: hypothetical protein [Caudoviricetes sp.]